MKVVTSLGVVTCSRLLFADRIKTTHASLVSGDRGASSMLDEQ